MARCFRAISRKFARTFETSLCWRTSVASWDVARFISTDCTWRKSGLSRSIPRIKVQAAVSFWYGHCCRKRRSTKKHAVTCICLFTRKPEFFSQLGFAMAQREDLPDKIYKDCCVCPRFHCCDEVAMVRGELPKFAILPEPTNWQVKLQA